MPELREVFNSIVAVQLDFKMYRGDKVSFVVGFWEDEDKTIPFDLSPMAGTLKMSVKRNINEPRSLGTLEEGTGLTIGAVTNELTIETSGLISAIPAANYFYDVEGLITGDRLTFLAGKVIVTEDVTR